MGKLIYSKSSTLKMQVTSSTETIRRYISEGRDINLNYRIP